MSDTLCTEQQPAFGIREMLCPVLSNEWINAEYKHLVVSATGRFLEAEPGQFFNLKCPVNANDHPFLRRPMSVYLVDRAQGRIEFLYKVHGAGTRALASLQAGAQLDVLGPLGKGFVLGDTPGHLLLLGRGAGIATLAPLAECVRNRGGKVTALLSARSTTLLTSHERLLEAQASVITVTDDDGSSEVSAVAQRLRHIHAETPFDLLAACGSQRLIHLLQSFCREYDVPGQVALEQRMACAIGMCFACVHPIRKHIESEALSYQRVCCDGPVFDYRLVIA